MANYDRELFKNYHLFFLDPRQKDYIVTDGKEFINQYFSGNSFFDIYCDSLEVTGEKTAVDEDGLYLKHEIREWMKYREEKEIAKVLEDIIRNTKKNDGERKECQEEVDSAETDIKKEQDEEVNQETKEEANKKFSIIVGHNTFSCTFYCIFPKTTGTVTDYALYNKKETHHQHQQQK